MLKLKTKIGEFGFTDSIDELSATRFFLFNKYLSLQVHLPNALNVNDYLATIIEKVDAGETKQAISGLQNLQIAYNAACNLSMKEISLKTLASLCITFENKAIEIKNDGDLQAVVELLEEANITELMQTISALKKKIEFSIEAFSDEEHKSTELEVIQNALKIACIKQAEYISRNNKLSPAIQEQINKLEKQIHLKVFLPNISKLEASIVNTYSKNALCVSKFFKVNISELTGLDYINALALMAEQSKSLKNLKNK